MVKHKNTCCVSSCKNTPRNSSCQFYSFPMSEWKMDQRSKWIAAINRKNADGSPWQPQYYHLICSDHFIGGHKSDEETHPSYVPTIFPTITVITHEEKRQILLSQKYPDIDDDQVRDVVYNVYTYFKKECEEFQDVKGKYFTNLIKRVSDATGVSTAYVSNLISEVVAMGPEAFLKTSSITPQDSCDSKPQNVVDVNPPKKKRRKKGSRKPSWSRPKKSGKKVEETFDIVNRRKYNNYSSSSFNQVDDSNKPFKIVDRSLYDLNSSFKYYNKGGNIGSPDSIKVEPSTEIDIVEHSLPDRYGGIEGPSFTNKETNGGSLFIKKEENEVPPRPVALFSNQITVKTENLTSDSYTNCNIESSSYS